MTRRAALELGLIGDNISASKAPLLHRLAGSQNEISVRYDRLIPQERGLEFDQLFAWCAQSGLRGINVTYPYKERVAKKVVIDDPLVRAIGAVNTVLFEPEGPVGYNTDYTGFVEAYRSVLGEKAPGIACLIGTGGVGRAIAFGLVSLGASEIRLYDREVEKAEAMARDLRSVENAPDVSFYSDAVAAARGASGLLNGTPVGMVGYPGTPLPPEDMVGAEWAFDAIYTPVDTEFLKDAEAEGLTIISGYELFIYQGVQAWKLFSGLGLNEERLRAELMSHGPDTG